MPRRFRQARMYLVNALVALEGNDAEIECLRHAIDHVIDEIARAEQSKIENAIYEEREILELKFTCSPRIVNLTKFRKQRV